jgi:hypothetical protein
MSEASFSFERLNTALADAGLDADARMKIVRASSGDDTAGQLPRASQIHAALAPHFDVATRHVATRALVNRGLASNDLGDALFANAAPAGRIDLMAASAQQARAAQVHLVLAHCQRLGIEIDGPISVHELDKLFASKADHPELKSPADRISIKHALTRCGLLTK